MEEEGICNIPEEVVVVQERSSYPVVVKDASNVQDIKLTPGNRARSCKDPPPE